MSVVVHIFSGPIHSGKTSAVLNWLDTQSGVFGVLSPTVDGKKVFMNIETKEIFNMEALPDEPDILSIGKFNFSKGSFDKAIEIIKRGFNKNGWLVIDEIGPLELKGEGFCSVLKEILSDTSSTQNIMLLVREGMVEMVTDFFGIENFLLVYIDLSQHS